MRKELGEGQTEEEPEGGRDPKEPRDPQDRSEDGREQPDGATGDGRRNDVPPWMASLPEQVRDSFVRGDFENVPAAYRELIQRYIRWLRSEEGPAAPGR